MLRSHLLPRLPSSRLLPAAALLPLQLPTATPLHTRTQIQPMHHGCTPRRHFRSGATLQSRPSTPLASDSAAASSSASSATPLSTASSTPSTDAPLPFAVVGSGPAAFYTCKYLLREHPHLRIDMFERLSVPYGLVRFGVAPDHPDVKSVIHDFEGVLSSHESRIKFWGNVEVGVDVSLEELRAHYAGVILAYGASSERRLNIPGAHLEGIHPSRTLVNWYNAHPEQGEEDEGVDFKLEEVENVVIIGQGNVAIDCARILLSPLSRLIPTDISTHAFGHLMHSKVQRVDMVGRRGAVQSAFSIGELREMATSVEGIKVVLDKDEMERSENESSLQEIAASRPKKRKHDLMKQIVDGTLATAHKPDATHPAPKELHIRFLLNPKEFLPREDDPTRVGAVVFEKTELSGPPEKQSANPTGETVTLPAQLVLTSIGYRSLPIPGVPFDQRRHVIPSVAGRVTNSQGEPESGLYVAGWLKRGPSGIIATNVMDARETVKSILADIKEGKIQPPKVATTLPLIAHTSTHPLVSREAWSRIDAAEQARGMEQGKPRVKFTNKRELLQAAGVHTQKKEGQEGGEGTKQ